MYKMIVVDDSEMTRQGIRASVNWEVMDVRIVGEAADGGGHGAHPRYGPRYHHLRHPYAEA